VLADVLRQSFVHACLPTTPARAEELDDVGVEPHRYGLLVYRDFGASTLPHYLGKSILNRVLLAALPFIAFNLAVGRPTQAVYTIYDMSF
jgi:hypothetical protein